MICRNCGKEINTLVCYNCGADNNVQSPYASTNNISPSTPLPVVNDGIFGNGTLTNKNGVSATITAMDWFKLFGFEFLIALIPFVGAIGALVYSIVLFCKSSTAPSIRGYIKFNLIVSIIAVALSILIVVLFSTIFLGYARHTLFC